MYELISQDPYFPDSVLSAMLDFFSCVSYFGKGVNLCP